MKNIFKTIIKDFQSRLPIEDVQPRELQVPVNSGKIISVIGPRRSGKTYFFFSLINHLLNQVSPHQIVYINFEDERLEVRKEHFQSLIDAYFELFPEESGQNIYFFFDEIQEIPGWEKFVRRVYDTISQNIFITGSSSKMLGKEIATHLRGRHLTYRIFPLSFREFCQFQSIDVTDVYSTRGKAILNQQLFRYLMHGSFPEILFLKQDLITRTLQSYFDVMIFRDIVERYQVRNTFALKYFIKKLFNTISSEFSIHKIFNELKSLGLRVSKDRLYEYLEYITDTFLFFVHLPYEASITRTYQGNKKIYAVDTGLINALTFRFTQDIGKLLENVVFLHLLRQEYPIYFLRNDFECDFIQGDDQKIFQAVQVTFSLSESSTREREIASLVKALKRFNLKQGLIITFDERGSVTIDDRTIEIVPAWEWLLTV